VKTATADAGKTSKLFLSKNL